MEPGKEKSRERAARGTDRLRAAFVGRQRHAALRSGVLLAGPVSAASIARR